MKAAYSRQRAMRTNDKEPWSSR